MGSSIVGNAVTSRDGTPVGLCRSFRAPFWVCAAGVIVADYGDDEEAAEAHYASLVAAHRSRKGGPAAQLLGDVGRQLYRRAVPSIGIDMAAPFGVYVDGVCIAEHDTQADADAHAIRLRAAERQAS